jgi:hypothetical protein
MRRHLVPGGMEISVSDTELFDFLDDILTDSDFHASYIRHEKVNGQRWHVMYFDSALDLDRISHLMDSVTNEQIERIVALNE